VVSVRLDRDTRSHPLDRTPDATLRELRMVTRRVTFGEPFFQPTEIGDPFVNARRAHGRHSPQPPISQSPGRSGASWRIRPASLFRSENPGVPVSRPWRRTRSLGELSARCCCITQGQSRARGGTAQRCHIVECAGPIGKPTGLSKRSHCRLTTTRDTDLRLSQLSERVCYSVTGVQVPALGTSRNSAMLGMGARARLRGMFPSVRARSSGVTSWKSAPLSRSCR